MEWLTLEQLQDITNTYWTIIAVKIADPWFWAQFALIAGVFILAKWVLSPLLERLVNWFSTKTGRFGNLNRLFTGLKQLNTVIAWLLLQWIAIGIVGFIQWPHAALTIVASLLTAWVIIRILSFLIRNKSLARILALFAWSIAALNILGALTPAMELMDQWALNVGAVKVSILTAIKALLALWFALWLASSASTFVERQLGRSESITPAMSALAAKLTRITLILVAILIALSAVGIDLTALAVFSGALGVGLGFGLQKIFSNLVSGVILLLDRSIKPGDVITLGNTFGWINYLGARYVSVITRDGIEHLIPNEELITQRVENWSFSNDLVRLRVPVGISYKSNPRQAAQLCVDAAMETDRVLQDPEPRCNVIGFGDSSVNMELRIWIDDPTQGRGNVVNDVYLNIWDKFHEEGIEIPFPQRDLHLQSVLGEKEISILKEEWNK